ncbi:MAG: ABC transporter permease [Actinomyces sp.]|nr:MAG: ABC transporter permease [Actinomyces sp.]
MRSVLALWWTQVRGQNRIFWRSPVSAFFTIVLPLVMLVLFVALFGNDTFDTPYGSVKVAQFYTPGLAVFSAASATYTNIGINLAIRRDEGILKRVRGTPLPPGIYLAGQVGSAVWIALLSVVLMVGVGVAAYGVEVEASSLGPLLAAFVAGTACFAVLGVALAAAARSAAGAPAIANITILPLAFVSQIFVSLGPERDTPAWLRLVGDVFPLKHFALLFGQAMTPGSGASTVEWWRLGVLAAWAVVGAVFAWRRFVWEPRPGAATTRHRRRRTPAA